MHKLMLKFFEFLKNTAHFLKIVIIFCILCLLLYWAQNLAGFKWNWLNFIKPLLDSFIYVGSKISDDSVKLFSATFENKYAFALLIFFGLYYIAYGLQYIIQFFENLYKDGRNFIKKKQEDAYNRDLVMKNTAEQEQIKNYQIYIAAFPKKQTSHFSKKIDLEDETKEMNKYLIQQLSVNPIKYGAGFLYKFNDFNHIDDVLTTFFKVVNSDAPLDYIVCVQILPKQITDEFEKMSRLIALNLVNQITTLSDTVWRYNFNKIHKYKTMQIGLYQKDNDTFEAHEFVKI